MHPCPVFFPFSILKNCSKDPIVLFYWKIFTNRKTRHTSACYSPDYVNCPPLKRKIVTRREKTLEETKANKENRKIVTRIQDENLRRNFKTKYFCSVLLCFSRSVSLAFPLNFRVSLFCSVHLAFPFNFHAVLFCSRSVPVLVSFFSSLVLYLSRTRAWNFLLKPRSGVYVYF